MITECQITGKWEMSGSLQGSALDDLWLSAAEQPERVCLIPVSRRLFGSIGGLNAVISMHG